jgi:proteic killer suppression protein
MKIKFDKKYLQELYETGATTDKKHRFQPDIVKRYQVRIGMLEDAEKIEELFAVHSLHYEVLKGDKAGLSSIRVNDRYRIEFTVTDNGAEPLVNVCNILELSNHYK